MESVVICGSTKFASEAREFAQKLIQLGVTVFVPHFYNSSKENWDQVSEYDKQFIALGLTHDHFYKIRMADTVFVYNKNGYVGNSVTLEIGYAVACNKPIYSLSDQDEELCRRVLFRGVYASAEELAKVLRS